MDNAIDIIVIGAGPAGIACATVAAREGKKVVVIERGKLFGSKNMFGGAIYLKSIKELYPTTWQNAPLERFLTKHSWNLLTSKNSTSISCNFEESENAATVFRPKFDEWMVEEAKKAGVYFAPSTVVRDLIIHNGQVMGVRTDIEDYFAPITVIAEGANSLLSEKAGFVKKGGTKDMILSVKEIIKLPQSLINDRFNLKNSQGCVLEFFGGLEEEILALGFLYTFKNHVSIGLGVTIQDLKEKQLKPYELLEKLKSHPDIEALIKGGETIEYSAHLIPDGGYNANPKIFSDGVMLVGDCCSFVNPVHFEGTNLAVYSGIFAGEVAVEAIDKGDFTKKVLKGYKKKLDESFVVKDLKSYKNIMKIAYENKKTLSITLPDMAKDFFEAFTGANSTPKKQDYVNFIKKYLKEIIKDAISFIRAFLGIITG